MTFTSAITAEHLRCEHLPAPMGLNVTSPRFSWALSGAGRNRRMTAYQIVAGIDVREVMAGKGDLWDSGKIQSDQSQLVPWAGAALSAHTRVYWSVRVWDEADAASLFACPAEFDTGLLGDTDWRAKWITRPDFDPRVGRIAPMPSPYDNSYQALPAFYFRRSFEVGTGIKCARIYVTALGLYEAHLNGQKLGDERFCPGWTDYYTRVEYQLYDLTDQLTEGENVLGLVAGEGWYSGRVANTLKRQGAHYGPKPAVTAALLIEYEDGRSETILTNETWSVHTGPIVYSDFLMGEKYDARLDVPNWNRPGHNSTDWWPVEVIEPYPTVPVLNAPRCEPVRRTEELPAHYLHKSPEGGLVFDLGQNIAGWVRLELDAVAGHEYRMRHAEALLEDGGLYTVNLRSAEATDIYIAAEDGVVRYEPTFTFHGFRYVELSGAGIDPASVKLTGIQLNSDLVRTGWFECGNDAVNKLMSNVMWSQRGNFLSVPTDCPQRDERLGWLADAQIFWPTASYNMDVAAFFTKWMRDIADTQFEDGAFTDVAPSKPHWAHRPFPARGAPAWGDGAVILMWEHYRFYGDAELVRTYWRPLLAWLDFILRHNPDLVRENRNHNNYGDWLNLGKPTPKALVATAYWARLCDLMERLAQVVGDEENGEEFARLAGRIRQKFVKRFVDRDGRLEGDTQTGYLLALDFGLLKGAKVDKARAHLRRVLAETDDHLATGFLGVRHLCPVLSDNGFVELAYKLLLTEDYPSWLFAVLNGATTIWERWDGWTPENGFQPTKMNSLNHYAYGAVGEWLYSRVAGIDCAPEGPGFAVAALRPLPSRALGWARATYRSHRGDIASGWSIVDDRVQYKVSLPPGVSGRLELPAEAESICLDGSPASGVVGTSGIRWPIGATEVNIGSGEWDFEWPMPQSSADKAAQAAAQVAVQEG